MSENNDEVDVTVTDEAVEEETAAVPVEEETPAELEQTDETQPSIEVQTLDQPDQTIKEKEKVKTILVNLNASVKDQLNKHYLTFLPEFLPSSGPYCPILYTFRAPVKGQSGRLKHITAKPPPFYVLFDHSIAVVWSLFDKQLKKNKLGIVQLHWALYFLESIANTEINSSKDLHFCIDTIRDRLIDIYSDLSEQSAVYCNATLKDYMPTKESQIFSWNYSNLFNRCPAPQASETADSKLLEELENIKQLVGIDSVDLSNVQSKEQVMNVLKKWQKEQLVKTQEDEKTLQVVEEMIKNLGGGDDFED